MITAIYALDSVVGAEFWLIGCVFCLLLSMAVALGSKNNRKPLLPTVSAIVLSAVLCDVFWFFRYFPGGEYINMGIASAWQLLLYPLCITVGVSTVTFLNSRAARGKKE